MLQAVSIAMLGILVFLGAVFYFFRQLTRHRLINLRKRLFAKWSLLDQAGKLRVLAFVSPKDFQALLPSEWDSYFSNFVETQLVLHTPGIDIDTIESEFDQLFGHCQKL